VDGRENKVTAERLTGRERLLRGLGYFLVVFAVVFVFVTLSVDFHPEVTAGGIVAAGLLCAFFPAALAGGMMSLFSTRRRWHGFWAVGAAVLVVLACGLW
jgi:hypothetical protein